MNVNGSFRKAPRCASGFTLIEVIIALGIVSGVVFLGYGTLNAAIMSDDVTQDALESIETLDRTWQLLEQDMRNAVARETLFSNVSCASGFCTEIDRDYVLKFVRAGRPNPLNLKRSQLQQVAYRWEDQVLYRDTWSEVTEATQDDADSMRLLKKVTDLELRFLPPTAKTLAKRSWRDRWPEAGGNNPTLPAALEVTLEVKGFDRMTRIFSIEDNTQDVAQANPPGSPSQGANNDDNNRNTNDGNSGQNTPNGAGRNQRQGREQRNAPSASGSGR